MPEERFCSMLCTLHQHIYKIDGILTNSDRLTYSYGYAA